MFQDFYAQSRHLIWPLLGLLIFVASFVLVLIYAVYGMRDPERLGRLARLPLEADDTEASVPANSLRTNEDKGS